MIDKCSFIFLFLGNFPLTIIYRFIYFLLSLAASMVSGFFASACSLPFDYVKTQIQKMQPDAEGKFPYSGSLDCSMKTLKAGGPFKFYTGFPVYCVRIAPHVMVYLCLFLVCFINKKKTPQPWRLDGR